MKGPIKNMTKNSKLALFFFVAMTAVSTVIRYFQSVLSIDAETGFYYEDSGFLGVLLYIVLGVTAVGLVLLAFLDRKKGSAAFTKKAELFTSKQNSISGVLFLIAGCGCFYSVISMFGGGLDPMSLIGSVIASAAFLRVGFIMLGNKTLKPACGYILLVLTVYYTVRSASLFMSTLIITRISESLIELLVYVSLVLFLLNLGRIYSRNETKLTRVKTIALGFICSSMCLSMSIARLIGVIAAPDVISPIFVSYPIEYFTIGILTAGTTILLYAKPSVISID